MFDAEFFPTPRAIARRMLAKFTQDPVNFLDPSAGKGDLAEVVCGELEEGYVDGGARWGRRRRHSDRKIDCIEANPELAHILRGKDLPVVGYDWLTYDGVSYYDAIIMNPPFSNGDEHLLKAWDFIHSGEIVCLLNAETINNPYTERRQRLVKIVMEYGSVEQVGDCFSTAARKTDVSVVMVYLRKMAEDDRAELWGLKTEEKPVDDSIGPEDAMLAIRDDLGNMQHYYDMANAEMFKAFRHIRRAAAYLGANGIQKGYDKDGYGSVIDTAWNNMHTARAEFSRKHRKDAWECVFNRMQFHKWLDHKQQQELLRDVAREMHLPFTKENIQATLDNIFEQRRRLFEQSAANVFDELTRYHAENTVHSEGWKTNDNYKVNERLVFPHGCRYEGNYRAIGAWGHHYGRDMDIYADLDRILCVLAARQFENCCTIGAAMSIAFDRCNKHPGHTMQSQWAESDFFEIRFFKKGTVHLKFKDKKLLEQFNITAASGKRWLGQNTNGRSDFPGRRPEYRSGGAGVEPKVAELVLANHAPAQEGLF